MENMRNSINSIDDASVRVWCEEFAVHVEETWINS